GVAIGIRSQVAWLTLPLLSWRFVTGLTPDNRRRPVVWGQTRYIAAVAAGVLTWLIPLIALTGGPRAYWRALSAQGEEDLGGIRMLWTTPTLRQLADALYFAFVAPWATWPIAAAVLAAAALGAAALLRDDRRVLTVIAVASGPYLAFDILFQETFTI